MYEGVSLSVSSEYTLNCKLNVALILSQRITFGSQLLWFNFIFGSPLFFFYSLAGTTMRFPVFVAATDMADIFQSHVVQCFGGQS